MSRWQVGTLDVWPDPEALVVSWLTSNLPDVNVRTETDATFATSSPNPGMRMPLVLVQAVTMGMETTSVVTKRMNVDVTCYAANTSSTRMDGRAKAWELYHRVNAWMLRAKAQTTPVGTFDDVFVHDELGIVPDSNPNLRRVIATYGIAARAETTAV